MNPIRTCEICKTVLVSQKRFCSRKCNGIGTFAIPGRKLSDEHRKKISDSNKGKLKPSLSVERRKYLSEINKGKMSGSKHWNWKGGVSKDREYIKEWSKGWRNKNRDLIRKNNQRLALSRKERLAGRKKPDTCEVCDKKSKIVYEHDHKTGKFRGWLCIYCNVALGQVFDNPAILRKLANYLENNI